MVWIFCPEMTPAQFPKSDFWNFCWIFCPEMTLAQFPEFGFFVRNSRIGVDLSSLENPDSESRLYIATRGMSAK